MAFTVSSVFRQRSDIFDFNLKFLFYLGLWPNDDWSKEKKWIYNIYGNTLLIFFFIYITMTGIGAYMYRDDAIVVLNNLDKKIVAYNFFLKTLLFYVKRDRIKNLVDEILYSGDKVADDRKKLMAYHIIVICGLSTAAIGGFQIVALINGELVVDAWFPFDPTKSRFTLFTASQILGVFFMPCLYRGISIQGIVCSIIMYVCDQLVELQNRLKALYYTVETDSFMRAEFKKIIKKHIRLVGYSKYLKETFKEYFLIQNLAVTAELCLNALLASSIGLQKMKVLVTFTAFLLVALLNAYIFCYLGNELMDQSFGVASAAYESTWTSWPVDMQKDLLIVITAAQRSFKLSAGGIAYMSMQTFAEALYNGYSIFAVLRDVVN